MARQTINTGTTANDGTGDALRVAGTKINNNFVELYSVINNLSNVALSGSFSDLIAAPLIPTDVNDLTDNNQLLDAVSIIREDVTVTTDNSFNVGSTTASLRNVFTRRVSSFTGALDVSGDSITNISGGNSLGIGNVGVRVEGSNDTDVALAGYNVTATAQGQIIITAPDVIVNGALQGTLTGNVNAQDGTLLVDAAAGTIPDYVSISDLKSIAAAAADFADFQLRISNL